MTNEMIERVARAMERESCPQWDDAQFEVWWNSDPFFCENVTGWGHFTGTRKEHRLWEARTAIRGMREPTESMIAAGVLVDDDFSEASPEKAVTMIYDAMMDSAISK